MTVRYLSICSGIESATVAWHPLGWQPVAFAEIDRFPSAVLAHHYPEVPNLGDFTKITRAGLRSDVDLLIGGTPCQDFSVAGLRAGLGGDRGNLTLEYLRLADRLRPRWLVWENVPGVMSSNDGRDFGTFLGGMVELGYGFGYRVLDAQYIRVDGYARAVPQRRRRVFVVGHLGDWRPAAAVLFERESLSGHPAPRREAGQGTAPTLSARTQGGGGLGTDFDLDGGLVAGTIGASLDRGGTVQDAYGGTLLAFGGNNQSGPIDVATAQTAHGGSGRIDFESETFIAFDCKAGGDTSFAVGEIPGALRGEGHGGGHSAVAFDTTQITSGENRCNPQPGDPCHPLAAQGHAPAIAMGVALRGREHGATAELTGDVMTALRCGGGGGDKPHVLTNWQVRRLTPRECERLMGFPDDYTNIPWRGKPHAPDGPRYKALGNSKAVNCVRWIGLRIAMVEQILREAA